MTNSNRIKLTWISFFSYALTGALVIVTGMVMGNIADYFQLPVSSMSNTFTFLNAGILISIFLNAWLMEIVPLKTQLRFGFVLMVAAVAPDAEPQHRPVLCRHVRTGPGERYYDVYRYVPDYPHV
jgi:TsgA-like MFS transporter